MKDEIKFLSENLYRFRKEKGISQEELANIIKYRILNAKKTK